MEEPRVKEEILDYITPKPDDQHDQQQQQRPSEIIPKPIEFIDLSSSSSSDSDFDSDDSDDDSDDDGMRIDTFGKRIRVSDGDGGSKKKRKKQKLSDTGIILPVGFLEPICRQEETPPPQPPPSLPLRLPMPQPIQQFKASPNVVKGSKQFWKAGDYEDSPSDFYSSTTSSVGMDHVRVHPKFLHSNATSHKWALGAFAELLDNALDEVCYGATYVNIDMIQSVDRSRMLLIEDNGGGMTPDKMRRCMSLGYSEKSKLANVIGQYGNGFKTSTMRLGADVIVFSRCRGKNSESSTQSIGMLSYTFLKSTGKEDIVVPMIDFEKGKHGWNKLFRSSPDDWSRNADTIVQWSPYSSEAELFNQFNLMSDQGTRIFIYNLWEDDQGELELDFGADRHDIQIRGGNRDEKKIEMARQFPNSRHFLTYRHSLRSYASILYLRLPPGFRIVLRGKDVVHHNIINDLMLTQEVTYKPQPGGEGVPKDPNMVAIVTVGFVKDAKDHIDVQGFNVYHKNRLIKPFWRVWNAAGSDGRGVIGVLEANFVEPAHDKQGFERTTVLLRLESRLVQMQKTYWSSNCHKIGYAPRVGKLRKIMDGSAQRESSPEYSPYKSSKRSSSKGGNTVQNSNTKFGNRTSTSTSSLAEDDSECEVQTVPPKSKPVNASACEASPAPKPFQRDSTYYVQSSHRYSNNSASQLAHVSNGTNDRILTRSQLKATNGACNGNGHASNVNSSDLNNRGVENCGLMDRLKEADNTLMRELEVQRENIRLAEAQGNDQSSVSDASSLIQLSTENRELKERLKKAEEDFLHEIQFEKDRCKSLEAQLQESKTKMDEMIKEQEALIDIFADERNQRANEEENLRRKLKDASTTIQTLLERVRLLEKMKSPNCKQEHPQIP